MLGGCPSLFSMILFSMRTATSGPDSGAFREAKMREPTGYKSNLCRSLDPDVELVMRNSNTILHILRRLREACATPSKQNLLRQIMNGMGPLAADRSNGHLYQKNITSKKTYYYNHSRTGEGREGRKEGNVFVQMYVMLQPSQLPKGQVYGQVSLPWGVEG
jgi:hypothetical protein